MSKRNRTIPAPFLRTIPSVIRSFGPRLVIAASACALLLFCTGGTYLLSHNVPLKVGNAAPKTPQKISTHAVNAQVLGDSTTQNTETTEQSGTSSPQATNSHPETTPSAASTTATTTPINTPVTVQSSPQQTSVVVQVPRVGGVSLTLPLGL